MKEFKLFNLVFKKEIEVYNVQVSYYNDLGFIIYKPVKTKGECGSLILVHIESSDSIRILSDNETGISQNDIRSLHTGAALEFLISIQKLYKIKIEEYKKEILDYEKIVDFNISDYVVFL